MAGSDVTDVTREFCFGAPEAHLAAEKERARVFGADPLRSKRLLLHSGLDVGNMQSARRLVQIATYLYLLAFELLGFVLVIDLVGSGVGLQDVLVAGLHHGSGEGLPILRCRRRRALRRTGLIWNRRAGLCRAGLRRARRWACRRTRSGRRARTRAGLIAGLGKRRRQHSYHQRKNRHHTESLLHYFRSSRNIDELATGLVIEHAVCQCSCKPLLYLLRTNANRKGSFGIFLGQIFTLDVCYRKDCTKESRGMLMRLFAGSQPIQEHLLDRLIVSHQDVAHGMSTHEMANFLGEVLHVVTSTLKRLSHEDDLQAGLTLHVLWIFNMAQ